MLRKAPIRHHNSLCSKPSETDSLPDTSTDTSEPTTEVSPSHGLDGNNELGMRRTNMTYLSQSHLRADTVALWRKGPIRRLPVVEEEDLMHGQSSDDMGP